MENKFNLSDKIVRGKYSFVVGEVDVIDVINVKEFIKLLKRKVRDARTGCDCHEHMIWDRLIDSLLNKIDNLAGDKLI